MYARVEGNEKDYTKREVFFSAFAPNIYKTFSQEY